MSTIPQFHCDDAVRNYVAQTNLTNNATGGTNTPGSGSISTILIICLVLAGVVCVVAAGGFYWYWKKPVEIKAKKIDDLDTTSIAPSEGTSVTQFPPDPAEDRLKDLRQLRKMNSYQPVPKEDHAADNQPLVMNDLLVMTSSQPPILAENLSAVDKENITRQETVHAQPPILAEEPSCNQDTHDNSNSQPPILLQDYDPKPFLEIGQSQPPIILLPNSGTTSK
ncbi:hypothetical protein HDV01_001324 [Terramyces sp. JEL0728]|nr:hypothetical protein HDV01_001324 [Terramyces sp. JEL0728]